MKVGVIASNKGGGGKSTITHNLAIAALRSGTQVAVIDLDPQSSLEGWSDIREDDESLPTLSVIGTKPARLPRELKKLKNDDCDLVLIDTAPHSTDATMTALEQCNHCLIPSRASLFDFQAVQRTLQLLTLTGVPGSFVVNAVKNAQAEHDIRRGLKVLVESAPPQLTIEIAPPAIADRIAFSHCLTSGMGVMEYEPSGKAAHEIKQLWKWYQNRIEL